MTEKKQLKWAVREDRETLVAGTNELAWEIYDPLSVLREAATVAKVYRIGEAGMAHANLLAAAPDLLSALKDADFALSHDPAYKGTPLKKKIEAAIAAAVGNK